jgi:hypothetical protein
VDLRELTAQVEQISHQYAGKFGIERKWLARVLRNAVEDEDMSLVQNIGS